MFLIVVSFLCLLSMFNADLCKSLVRANSYYSDNNSSEDDLARRHSQAFTAEDEDKLLKSNQLNDAKDRRITLNIHVIKHQVFGSLM